MMRFLVLACLVVISGCAQRGEFTFTDAQPDVGQIRTVFTATTRQPVEDASRFGEARSLDLAYARYDVSVPPQREEGQIAWPKPNRVDPATQFVTRGEARYDGDAAFKAALRAELARLPKGSRDLAIFVHGFNSTFAEGVYRMAQLSHDFDVPGVAVHFSWPSAGNPLGYVYDRDSAMFSRDGLAELLQVATESGAERIVILAHSMGSFLTMEALRQVALEKNTHVSRRVSGVVLLSPDIDVEVFRSQAKSIGALPQPFIIFVSRRDRALALSARLTGQRERLGNLATADEVADLQVTLVDVSAFQSDMLNHFTVGNSQALISLMSRLPAIDRAFQSGRPVQAGLLPGTVLTVQSATEVILSPLVQIAN